MKIPALPTLALAALCLFALPRAEALVVYALYQYGWSGGVEVSGGIKITDENYGGVISTAQVYDAVVILHRVVLNGERWPWVSGFELVSVSDFNTVTGTFSSLVCAGHVAGTTVTITPFGGSLTSFNGTEYFTFTTTQAPVVTFNTPDSTPTAALAAMALVGLLLSGRIHRLRRMAAPEPGRV